LTLASLCRADRRDLRFHRGGKFADADLRVLGARRQRQFCFPPLTIEPLVFVADILGDAFANDD